MMEMESRRPGKHGEVLKDKTKFRITDDSSRRNAKPVELTNRRSEDSLSEENKMKRNMGISHQLMDVELEVKETQTKEKREEKGLQISMGRHVSRALPVLAMTGSQTEKPAFLQTLREKLDKTPPYLLYLTAAAACFASVLGGVLLVKELWPPPEEELPPRPDGIFKRLFLSIGWFFHTCGHCPKHR